MTGRKARVEQKSEEATGGSTTSYRERNSTADRALDILLLFDDNRLVISGQEVATRLGVARSTAYRYLQSLVGSGFIEEQQPTGYRLGPRVFELARLARKGLGLSEVARPVMRELAAEASETVLLTRRSGTVVVCLEREEADQPVRLSYERGHVLPVNAGAAALVLLAWAPDEEVERVLTQNGGLPRFTGATVTDPATLRRRLQTIRSENIAISSGELDEDVMGIAAPIRDARGEVTAAVSIAALSYRVPHERVPALATAVREAAGRISEQLAVLDA
ncbi:IclR family transcriptional regulator [Streptomyces sp. NBC_00878]|uniref:IclR family transcriptional regulator n=1 Tax=Streptomyces sp. NBC_00878 TaxID=2975854 RepID=UPI00225AB9FD|nr:IclR family transcriptional regulator [Streptomyces sp. NBC_00878]MCX4904669.1 IclR family transcriptional regulator [Streptomyces sp. NBC_00878]